jgi:hypothetical protein
MATYCAVARRKAPLGRRWVSEAHLRLDLRLAVGVSCGVLDTVMPPY